MKEPGFDWIGTREGMERLARDGINPTKGTPIDDGDYNCKWLRETYAQMLTPASASPAS